jgi:hypothetical protein
VGGTRYRYALRPYDLAGNRGPMSATVEVLVPLEHVGANPLDAKAEDPGEVAGCTAGVLR